MSLKVSICTNPLGGVNSRFECPPLEKRLRMLGFEIVNCNEKADYYIGFNHHPRWYERFIELGGTMERSVLIRLEPKAVFPAQYSKKIELLYGRIFTLGGTNNSEFKYFAWPYYLNINPLNPEPWTQNSSDKILQKVKSHSFTLSEWKSRSHLLTLIASNKVSAVKNNNYRMRRNFAWRLPASHLSVFGNFWGSSIKEKLVHRFGVLRFALKTGSGVNVWQIYGNLLRKYQNYRGQILNKHDLIGDSKFSLVIENDNGYVSEKLIDALIGGSIPIYFGGDFSKFGIPRRSVVTNLKNESDVINFIDCVSDDEIAERLRITKKWLDSNEFLSKWFGDNVFDTLANEIGLGFRKMDN